MNNYKELARAAISARRMAYAPYSKFYVGAAILSTDGRIFTGCNVENAAYGAGICAERTAVFKAVSEGAQEFEAIAVCGGSADLDVSAELPLTSPCGICRQVMQEFCCREFLIHMGGKDGEIQTVTLEELLPFGFHL